MDRVMQQGDSSSGEEGNGPLPFAAGESASRCCRVVSVSSGKGGVGKTVLLANVAVALARQGKRVLVVDADLGLPGIDVACRLSTEKSLNDFFSGACALEEMVLDGPEGIHVLPAAAGVQEMTRLSPLQKRALLQGLNVFHGRFDLVLIDTGGGISEDVTCFSVASVLPLLVTTPEPTALADVCALMKVLSGKYREKKFALVVTHARDEDDAREALGKLIDFCSCSLDVAIDYLGAIPFDFKLGEAVRQQKTLLELYPRSMAGSAYAALAERLMKLPLPMQPKGGMQLFWDQHLAR